MTHKMREEIVSRRKPRVRVSLMRDEWKHEWREAMSDETGHLDPAVYHVCVNGKPTDAHIAIWHSEKYTEVYFESADGKMTLYHKPK